LVISVSENITLHGIFLTREHRRLELMRPLFERKQVRPVIDRVLPLEEVGKAQSVSTRIMVEKK
jgi:NADPH:quinone reductase